MHLIIQVMGVNFLHMNLFHATKQYTPLGRICVSFLNTATNESWAVISLIRPEEDRSLYSHSWFVVAAPVVGEPVHIEVEGPHFALPVLNFLPKKCKRKIALYLKRCISLT